MNRPARPKGPRWRRRKEERPAEIVAAALESFAERGFAATRLDDIAARAGVTRGTLYLYFSSKEDLFKAVVRQSIVPVIARGVERGEFRPLDMDHVFYCVVGPVLLTMLWKHSFEPYDGKRLDAEALCRAHLDLLLHGMLKPEGAP
jgi:AcrR family transcriptional regulator